MDVAVVISMSGSTGTFHHPSPVDVGLDPPGHAGRYRGPVASTQPSRRRSDSPARPARTLGRPGPRTGPRTAGLVAELARRRPEALAAGDLLTLQRTVGNGAIVAILASAGPTVQRHPNSAYDPTKEEEELGVQRTAGDGARGPTVQRTKWTYDGAKWKNGDTVSDSALLPEGATHKPGDTYDDATRKLVSSGNVSVKGESGLFGYGAVTPEQERAVRAGVVTAKTMVDATRAKTAAAVSAAEADEDTAIEAPIRKALSLYFNIAEAAPLGTALEAVRIIDAAVGRIQGGLESENLPIVKMADSVSGAGQVRKSVRQVLAGPAPVESPEQFSAENAPGDIQAKFAPFLRGSNFGAKVLVHEASHKFVGTWDFTYGMDSGVGVGAWLTSQAGVRNKSEEAVRNDLKWEAYTSALRTLVMKAMGVKVGKGITSTLEQKFFMQWVEGVKGEIMTADSDDARERIFQAKMPGLFKHPKVPAPWRAKFETFADPDGRPKLLAEEENLAKQVGASALFALPPKFLLNNADSYMDFIADVAG